MKNRSGKLALGGVMTALALVFLLLSAVPVTEISLAVLAGMVGVPVVIETGRRAGLLQYAAVSLLALLLVPAVEGKGLYIAFFGYYPVLKAVLEGSRLPRPAEWAVKLAVFNGSMVAAYYVMLTFFHLDSDAFTIGGVSLLWVFLLAGNLVFLLYDWCLTRLIALYMAKWHPRVRKLFHL